MEERQREREKAIKNSIGYPLDRPLVVRQDKSNINPWADNTEFGFFLRSFEHSKPVDLVIENGYDKTKFENP